jgi:hypothetical protein
VLSYPKQLIEVGGEPIITRTLRLVRELEPDARIEVVGRPELRSVCYVLPGAALLRTLSDPGYCVLDGIAATSMGLAHDSFEGDGWLDQQPLVFLLGDVVYSRAALAALLADPRPVVFAGTRDLNKARGEVFGCKFVEQARLRQLLSTVPCRWKNPVAKIPIRYPEPQGGHLRRLLWHTQAHLGLKVPRGSPPSKTWADAIYQVVSDFTTDIDEPAHLVTRVPVLDAAVRAEAAETPWRDWDDSDIAQEVAPWPEPK